LNVSIVHQNEPQGKSELNLHYGRLKLKNADNADASPKLIERNRIEMSDNQDALLDYEEVGSCN
jgi:hypothetical protein